MQATTKRDVLSAAAGRAVLLLVCLLLSPMGRAYPQQPSAAAPSSEAVNAAAQMLVAQQRIAFATPMVDELAALALDRLHSVKAATPMDAQARAEIIASAKRTVAANVEALLMPSDEIATAVAGVLSVQDMRQIRDAFTKPPLLVDDATSAIRAFNDVLRTPAGRRYVDATNQSGPVFHRYQMEVITATTEAVRQAVDTEVSKRGLRP